MAALYYKWRSVLISDIEKQLCRLEREILEVYDKLVFPNWGEEMHGFPQTLYGYMMECFSFIDLLSSHWKGNEDAQTKRMISFMNEYIRLESELNSVLVQVWRHKLMHTSRPRKLKNGDSNKEYYWLLHWYKHLPEEQHCTFIDSGNRRILNVGLIYFVRDIKRALKEYSKDLSGSEELKINFEKHAVSLESYMYKDISI